MNFFTRLPMTLSDSALTVLDPIKIKTAYGRVQALEVGSYAQWAFGSNDDSLISLDGNKTLTKQLSNDSLSYDSNSVTISGAAGRSLVSDLTAANTFTLFIVVKILEGEGLQVFSSNFTNIGDNPAAGYAIAKGSYFFINLRDSGTQLPTREKNEAAGSYVLGMVVDGSTAKLMTQDGVTSYTGHALVDNDAHPNLCLGNAVFDAVEMPSVQASEMILFDKALTDNEMLGVYERCVERGLARGLVVN
jgi:hypothetical protein